VKDEHIRLAIAEACGWKPERFSDGGKNLRSWTHPDYPDHYYPLAYERSLNALWEAEKSLSSAQNQAYGLNLSRACNRTDIWHASAKQKAEAFLRAIGKWA
jgi:hypothetical protein